MSPLSRARCGRQALADEFKCVALDCDGVLWMGPDPIPGSAEAVQKLQAAGKHLAFITNGSAKTRASVAERLGGLLGAPVAADSVVTSGSVAAAEVATRASTAFVIGAAGLREELQLAGVDVVEPELPEPPGDFDAGRLLALAEAGPRVEAVVVGHDEAFSYAKLAYAALLLQLGGEDCSLVGTNPDVANRSEAGYLVPEAGALIAAVEAASGRRARVVGKPEPAALEQLVRRLGLLPGEVLMVGDRLDTDVRFGRRAGARACLVLSGVATQEDAEAAAPEEAPDYIRACLADVVSD